MPYLASYYYRGMKNHAPSYPRPSEAKQPIKEQAGDVNLQI
jgi:hypothetical protein